MSADQSGPRGEVQDLDDMVEHPAEDPEEVDLDSRSALPAELRMGEDIARHLTHFGPDAPEEIATHIRKFWDPRMRQAILRAFEDGVELSPALHAGVEAYRLGEIDRREVKEPSGG